MADTRPPRPPLPRPDAPYTSTKIEVTDGGTVHVWTWPEEGNLRRRGYWGIVQEEMGLQLLAPTVLEYVPPQTALELRQEVQDPARGLEYFPAAQTLCPVAPLVVQMPSIEAQYPAVAFTQDRDPLEPSNVPEGQGMQADPPAL